MILRPDVQNLLGGPAQAELAEPGPERLSELSLHDVETSWGQDQFDRSLKRNSLLPAEALHPYRLLRIISGLGP